MTHNVITESYNFHTYMKSRSFVFLGIAYISPHATILAYAFFFIHLINYFIHACRCFTSKCLRSSCDLWYVSLGSASISSPIHTRFMNLCRQSFLILSNVQTIQASHSLPYSLHRLLQNTAPFPYHDVFLLLAIFSPSKFFNTIIFFILVS